MLELNHVGLLEAGFGLLLGAAFGAYPVLQPQIIGSGFPKLNSTYAIRPTFGRMAFFYQAAGWDLLFWESWEGG
ncbi:MAG: hypothetical protein AB1439_02545 [candidate division FCPU426 bacterium]